MQFSNSLDRGAHDFNQKIIHAAGIPIFPQQGVAQMMEALDHNAVFGRGEGHLEFLLPHSAVLLFAFIVSVQRRVTEMCEYSPASRGLNAMMEEKIKLIQFGQILTNQDSPFKRKTITKSS